MTYLVKAYNSETGGDFRVYYYSDESRAREKMSELLACLPDRYAIELKSVKKA